MIEFLAKFLITDNKNYSDPDVREKYGILCGAVGIFLNVLLFFGKFVLGTLISSVSMVADAVNNLSDAGSSIIQILGFKLSTKKPDPEHPFGHGRIEYIAGLVVSFLILLMGVELGKSSIQSIIHPQDIVQANWFAVGIMGIAILVKLYMYLYNHSIGKKINSVSMEAIALDSFSDMISTVVVIVSLILQQYVLWPVDGYAGVIVALFILKTGIESAQETIAPLLGSAPDAEFVKSIEDEALDHKDVVGVHDLVVHDYGPGRRMISLHVEVPGDHDIFELHDVIDNAEIDIANKFNCSVVIHMDPIDTKNHRLSELKQILKEEIEKISSELKSHDVRMVPGITHTNLIFDVVKPFSCTLSDEELKTKICDAIHERCGNVNCVITVDQPFVN